MLVEKGSINKAAKELFISQQSLSRSLHSLENEIGYILFHRSHHGITLTLAGEKFYNFALNVISEYNIMYESIIEETYNIVLEGNLKVGCSSLIAENIMPEILSNYYNEYKKINIDIMSGTNEDVVNKLSINDIEIGIIVFYYDEEGKSVPQIPDTFIQENICTCNTVIWSGNKLIAPSKEKIVMEDLNNYPIAIGRNTDLNFYENVVFKDVSLKPAHIPLSDNMNMISKMVERNNVLCVDMAFGENHTLYYNYFKDLNVRCLDVKSSKHYTLNLKYIVKERNMLINHFSNYLKKYFSF